MRRGKGRRPRIGERILPAMDRIFKNNEPAATHGANGTRDARRFFRFSVLPLRAGQERACDDRPVAPIPFAGSLGMSPTMLAIGGVGI